MPIRNGYGNKIQGFNTCYFPVQRLKDHFRIKAIRSVVINRLHFIFVSLEVFVFVSIALKYKIL